MITYTGKRMTGIMALNIDIHKPGISRFTRFFVSLVKSPRRKIPGVGVGLLQVVVDFLEVLPRNHALAPNLERLLGGNGQRHIEERAHRVGHVLANDALPAPGNGLL